MSSSSLGVFGCINELSRLVHRVDEVGVVHGADHHQVDFAAVQRLKGFLQAKIPVEEVRCARLEVQEKIEIAGPRVEGIRRRGAEQLEPAHVVTAAELRNLREVRIENACHDSGGLCHQYSIRGLNSEQPQAWHVA